MPYELAMDILNKQFVCLRSDYIIQYSLRDIFTPNYDPSTPLWEVVVNSMPYFWRASQHLEGIYFRSSMYPAAEINLSSVGHQISCGSLNQSRRHGFTQFLFPYLRYQPSSTILATQSAALPLMTGGTSLCLFCCLIG